MMAAPQSERAGYRVGSTIFAWAAILTPPQEPAGEAVE